MVRYTGTRRGFGIASPRPQASPAVLRVLVGAFPFAAGSTDSAILITLTPGSYTAQVTGNGETTGNALVEVYTAD